MTSIPGDLWQWFEAALAASGDDVASVNPDRLIKFLAANGLRITFDTKPAPDDTAFDGQHEDPRRALTARERDVLCRIIGDMYGAFRRGDPFYGRTDFREDGPMLLAIRDAIDPRGGD